MIFNTNINEWLINSVNVLVENWFDVNGLMNID